MRQDAAGARHRQRGSGTPVPAPGLDACGRDPRLCPAAAGRTLRDDGVLPKSRRVTQGTVPAAHGRCRASLTARAAAVTLTGTGDPMLCAGDPPPHDLEAPP